MTHSDGIVFRSGVMCFTYLESCRKIFFCSLNTSRLTLICCHKVSIYIHSTHHQDYKKQAECSVLTIIISTMSFSVNIMSQNEQHTIKYPHISKLTAEECPFADTGERNAARHHAVLCPVRHSLQRVSKQPLHAKRGCGTKTQDSKEGMNIYTVMTVKNIDTGNSQNRNAKTGKYVYNTHIYPAAVA